MLGDFVDYLNDATNISPVTISNYERGVRASSKQMLDLGIIEKPFEEMNLAEFETALFLTLNNDDFLAKDAVGHRMYSRGLKQFRAFLKYSKNDDSQKIIEKINSDSMLNQTERENLVKSRIGQGVFRQSILQKFDGKCVVTGISDARLLVASHIKPWAVSDNNDRISSENGFLLNNLCDKMFDLGLISFESDGRLLFSPSLRNDDVKILKLDSDRRYDLKSSPRQLQNLEYHRDVIFLK